MLVTVANTAIGQSNRMSATLCNLGDAVTNDQDRPDPGSASSSLARVAVDHAWLSYAYLADADGDGYGSLFEDDAVLFWPGRPVVRGRRRLQRFRLEEHQAGFRYTASNVFCEARQVAVTGCLSTDESPDVEFVDILQISVRGLFVMQRSFFHVAPKPGG